MKIKLAHGFANVEKNMFGSYLHIIMVEPEYRGKGIATRLMNKVIEQSAKPIYLLASSEYGSDFQRLTEFYSRFGFVKVKQKKRDGHPYNFNMVLY